MDYDEAISYLYSRGLFAIKLGLERISDLLAKLGDPQDAFPSIHVAGTNGKGSVTCFIATALQKQGYKVAIYTSPHLVDFCERIMIDWEKIPKERVVAYVERIRPFVTDHTFFEITTAMAFLHFKEQHVDIAVIEVGMGGRLDATNVLKPYLSVITSISLEHTQHLGSTIEKITQEKAGIIKKDNDVVTGAYGTALEVIEARCRLLGARLHLPAEKAFEIGMKGGFQQKNAAIASKALEILQAKGISLSEDAISHGFLDARWPGRLDFVTDDIIFDCAHNPDGCRMLAEEITNMGLCGLTLVIGIMKDKDIPAMAKELEKIAGSMIIVKPRLERSAEPQEIARHFSKNTHIIPDIKEALAYAMTLPGKTLLTGSIFAVGEGFSALDLEPFHAK